MFGTFKLSSIKHATILAMIDVFVLLAPAWSQPEGDSRGVKIIDGAPLSSATSPAQPDPGASTLPELPSNLRPGQPSATDRLAPKVTDPGSAEKPLDFSSLNNVKTANAAEVVIDILPGQDIAVGSRVSFRITTKKPGFLILIDIDPTGKLTQIYPNPSSLMAAGGNRQNANHVRPGKPIQIPNASDPFAGFEFITSPPRGVGLVVAFLSDRPVQMVDLPDVPQSLIGQAEAVAFVTKLAGDLRIPQGDGTGVLQETRWSIDAKFYSIR